MYLLKGVLKDNFLAIETIHNMNMPENNGVTTEEGYLVEELPVPPIKEGYYYSVYFNIITFKYEYVEEKLPLTQKDEEMEELKLQIEKQNQAIAELTMMLATS